jgi:hypothetical protein
MCSMEAADLHRRRSRSVADRSEAGVSGGSPVGVGAGGGVARGSSTVEVLRRRGSPAVGALRRRGSPPTHAAQKEVVGALDLRCSPEIGGARRRRGRGASTEEVELPPSSSHAPRLTVCRRRGSWRPRHPGSAPPVVAEGGGGAGHRPPSGRRLSGLPPLLPPCPEEAEISRVGRPPPRCG